MKKYIVLYCLILINIYGVSQTKSLTDPLRFDHFYTYDQITEALKILNKKYPDLTKLVEVGKSDENRTIWAIEINNKKTGKAKDKPGVYCDGNIHGNEIQAGEVCLYLANYLLTNYDSNEKIKKIVNRNAFYIIPIVNVDGRYHFFNAPNTMHSSRSLRIPFDDDHDGLFDEDMPDDLDGDGNICQMRKKDPDGNFYADPNDNRILIPVKKGKKGEYKMLGWEGIDNDKDGRINEDTEGYLDPNRNWGYLWKPSYIQRGAGRYPFEGKGIKAISDYLLSKKNIIVVFALHNSGGMFLRGPGNEIDKELFREDILVYDILGKEAQKIVPGYRYMISWKDLYTTFGDFTDFTHNILGAYSIVTELTLSSEMNYGINKTSKANRNEIEYARLQFNDNLGHGALYKEWKPYNHPVYGKVEIGGWTKFSRRIPPQFMLQDVVHRNASAIIFAASQTPDVHLSVSEKTKISSNVTRLKIKIENKNGIPTMSQHSIARGLYHKDILKIDGQKTIAGGKVNNTYLNTADYKKFKPQIQFTHLKSYEIQEFIFLIEGSGTITINYNSVKAGQKSISVKI